MGPPLIRVFHGDRERVLAKVYRFIESSAKVFLKEKGLFNLCLAGGRTPEELYRMMGRSYPFFDRTLIVPTDERLVPEEDPRNNCTMIRESLGSRAKLRRVKTELEPLKACGEFNKTLSEVGLPDLTLLGLGEDGHTASLFPGRECRPCGRFACITEGPDGLLRVSVTLEYINSSCYAVFLVLGKRKREALKMLLSGENIPASKVRPRRGVFVFTDLPL